MSKKEVLVEYINSVNNVIKQPLHQTQRIKFTCYDVSYDYIVFGATSGGVYVFSRYPCKFIKLIPNKEGAVTNVVISPGQKYIALSTTKGFVVVIQNCFSDSNIHYQIYTQHEGNIITVMKWSLSELYCGDSMGHVSVISLTQLLTKALFQTPSAILMRLDSLIVQLDVYSNFLLVSTKTRTYLCDTLQEQYRQIGKKLRDGNFGACFSVKTVSNLHDEETTRNVRNNEGAHRNRDDVKIYCARPGSRLWEASFDSCVVCTHQFRDSMHKNATSIIHLDENVNSDLIMSHGDENVPCSFNFEKIFVFNGYILTFKVDGIYIFDISTVSLLYWTNYYTNIRDVKLLDNTIYIWLDNNILKILTLLDIETFVLKILSRKQYLLCARFCLHWMEDILTLVNHNRLHVLKVLSEKLVDKKLLHDIDPMLKKVASCTMGSIKLENGIYLVDNLRSADNFITSTNVKTLQSNCEESLIKACSNLNSKINTSDTDSSSDKYLLNILNSQYQLHKINNTVCVPKFRDLMQTKTLEELKQLFDIFLEYTQSKNDTKLWITSQVLKTVYPNITRHFKDLQYKSHLFEFIFESFITLNKSDDLCNCLYPLPAASLKIIHYYEIGCQLIDMLPDFISLCQEVPSMYRYVLEKKCEDSLISTLPLLMQYDDIDLFKRYCAIFTYDLWDKAITCFIKLKSCICLNCDKVIRITLNLSWNVFANCMLHTIGGPNTLKLLSRNAKHIPSGELGVSFYQSCIFISCVPVSINDNKTRYSKFLECINKNEKSKTEFDLLICRYLKNKQSAKCERANIITCSTDINCSICDIPLKSILFQDHVKLNCGHFSHHICAINKDICDRCYISKT